MKVLIDIPGAKTPDVLEILQLISYVKAKPLIYNKALLILEIMEVAEEMKFYKSQSKIT
jgi:hypothetical protein